ncbi:hypothetical protein GCM10022223_33290 [Kineosporia mesophila]|uniref:Uncharacterized protein n=1 Tax=Kineosporia mesophila TaxID=566012 RepID=A0ABP6ZRL5_9ACTN
MLTHPGLVRAAPTRPGISRSRLPSAPPPCCDRDSGEGLSPPLETTTPHGARVRDVTFDEDRCQIRTGSAPWVMVALRSAAISLHRLQNPAINVAAALQHHARHPGKVVMLLTSGKGL